ncbi:MAG TPA: hypothetical protein VFP15_10155, partial [Gemmatimonadaceae bacterium]|nr:hypothetical protein [Gemmatimonadaceae bacterium]
MLDPAGRSIPVGNMPLAISPSPDGRFVVLSMSGWREQGIEVVNRATGRVVQRVTQPGAFLGLAWSADGATLYSSGGATDRIYVYGWTPGDSQPARLRDSLDLDELHRPATQRGARYPAGLAVSHDGRSLYVAENLADSLAVIDLASGRVAQRVGTGPYPYAVVASPDGQLYASDWGGTTVDAFHVTSDGRLGAERPIFVGRHPSALLLSPDGSRLFAASATTDRVAAIDTRAHRVVAWLRDPPPEAVAEGATPDAMALSADGTRLFVAEADANAVAEFELSAVSSGVPRASGADTLVGRIPTEWYPTAMMNAGDDSLWVVNGKGRGAGPNPNGPRAWKSSAQDDPRSYTLGQLDGTVTVLPAARGVALETMTHRVAHANGWDVARTSYRYPPITHVVYVIKENRTYDQVLGDLPQGDGDTSLTFFPRAIAPNHHALAERFGTYDRFFTNAEVSRQGHMWSTAGYVTDYIEKTTPDVYRGKRHEASDQGDEIDPALG